MIIHYLFIFITFIFTAVSSSHQSNFTLSGTAHLNLTSITLTQNLNNCTSIPPYPDTSGRLFYKNPIQFLDSNFNSTLSFSTHFSFTIVPPPSHCHSGEGIAFVITSDSNSLPYSVGCIGLPEAINQNTNSNSFLAVEFDSKFDHDLGDINDNHIGIDLNSIFSVASVDLTTNGIDLKKGGTINSWIEYSNSKKWIRIWVGYSVTKPDNPILVAPIDLSRKLHGFMYVGFSASNGKGSSVHLINNWQFKTSDPGTESGSDTVEVEEVGSDNCLICFPEVSHKEKPENRSETGNGSRNYNNTGKRVLELAFILLGINLILILLTVCSVVLYVCLRKKQNPPRARPGKTRTRKRSFQENTNSMPRRLKYSEIRSVTKGFNRNLIIGEGSSAIIYKTDGNTNFAVKRFKTGSFGSQFAAEFATMVGSLRHKNLMKLQGWCCEKNELILVYDFMPYGSLDKFLQNRTSLTEKLTFEVRLNVLIGVCSALLYLHDECERPIIHRKVKSCNIMLDFDLVPKLGGFGMGELYDHNSKARDGTVPARAMGYLAPEYVYSGVPTVKTDVYGFGVVVLEVASGRPPVDENGVLVTDWAWDLWEEKQLGVAADSNLTGNFNRIDMEMMLMVGLICVHPNYMMRPTMKEVMKMLKGEVVPKLPALKPTVMVTSERSTEAVARSGGDESVSSFATPTSHFSKV